MFLRNEDGKEMYSLISNLENLGYVVRIQVSPNHEVSGMCFISETAIKEARRWPEALTIDATYKTNAHKMSLANIVDTSNTSSIKGGNRLQTFAIAAAFINSETEAVYTWILVELREAVWPVGTAFDAPLAFVSDNEKALRNAIAIVFPESQHFLCSWDLWNTMEANLAAGRVEKDEYKYRLAQAEQQFWQTMTYERKFVEILEILFEDEDVHVFDGELVSEATQEMIVMQGKIGFGRKIDIIAKSRYNDVNLELSSIEFKLQGADDTTFLQQQSKNIRTNICILNKTNSITNESNSILYMDWRGREGCLALLHQNNDISICQYVDKLYIPKNLMELDSCEKPFRIYGCGKTKL